MAYKCLARPKIRLETYETNKVCFCINKGTISKYKFRIKTKKFQDIKTIFLFQTIDYYN